MILVGFLAIYLPKMTVYYTIIHKLHDIPNQVLASDSRCLDSRTDQGTSRQPNAPCGTNHAQTQTKGDTEIGVSIGTHVREHFGPTGIAKDSTTS